jgi:hypothetical protein
VNDCSNVAFDSPPVPRRRRDRRRGPRARGE